MPDPLQACRADIQMHWMPKDTPKRILSVLPQKSAGFTCPLTIGKKEARQLLPMLKILLCYMAGFCSSMNCGHRKGLDGDFTAYIHAHAYIHVHVHAA